MVRFTQSVWKRDEYITNAQQLSLSSQRRVRGSLARIRPVLLFKRFAFLLFNASKGRCGWVLTGEVSSLCFEGFGLLLSTLPPSLVSNCRCVYLFFACRFFRIFIGFPCPLFDEQHVTHGKERFLESGNSVARRGSFCGSSQVVVSAPSTWLFTFGDSSSRPASQSFRKRGKATTTRLV